MPADLPTRVALATRSEHKAREIRTILAGAPVRIVSLAELGIEARPEEAEIEVYETFRENAVAKARYFAGRTALPTIADDSGLRVDALEGAPGVRTKRFAGRDDLEGQALDDANLDHLLEQLEGVQEEGRGARYVCAAALLVPAGRTLTAIGSCSGRILRERRGTGGFGYDPVFFVPTLDRTFAQASEREKHALSHRGRAFRALSAQLDGLGSAPGGRPGGSRGRRGGQKASGR